MLKLYCKKIVFTIGFIAGFFIIAGVLSFITYLLFKDLFTGTARTITFAILALAFDFWIVCRMRYKNLYHKTDVIKNLSFWKAFINIFKSKDNLVHAFAFISILLPFFVTIAVSEKTPLLPSVVGMIFLLFSCGLIFLIVNTLIWSIVYKLIGHKSLSNT